MRIRVLASLAVLSCSHGAAFAQCAPAPDSPAFFRNLTEQRAAAKVSHDRAFFEQLLSDKFELKGVDGKVTPKQAFIEAELAATHLAQKDRFYAIRNFRLLEHRKGFVIASYVMTEGPTAGAKLQATESWQREVYKVENGLWHLAAIETAPPELAPPGDSTTAGAP
jgi:hypothetical protein